MIRWTCSSATSASCTNGPQLDRSEGISVSASHRPLTWPNRSSWGRTSRSMPSRASSRMLTRPTLVGGRPELALVQHRYDVADVQLGSDLDVLGEAGIARARGRSAQPRSDAGEVGLDRAERLRRPAGPRDEVGAPGRAAASTAPAPHRSSAPGRSEPSGQRSPAATTATVRVRPAPQPAGDGGPVAQAGADHGAAARRRGRSAIAEPLGEGSTTRSTPQPGPWPPATGSRHRRVGGPAPRAADRQDGRPLRRRTPGPARPSSGTAAR